MEPAGYGKGGDALNEGEVECPEDALTYYKGIELPSEVLPLLAFPEDLLSVEENFSRLSKIVPRYLYSSTSSTGSRWIKVVTAAASSLCLSESHHHPFCFADIQLQARVVTPVRKLLED